MKIRGLCERTKFDTNFFVMNNKNGFVMYRGVRNTVISYRPIQRRWEMKLVNNPNIMAISNASLESLAVGKLLLTSHY